jgi:hypothetical protein
MTKKINLIWWKFEPDLSYEYDWLKVLLSDFEVNQIVDLEGKVYLDNAIVVVNLSQAFFAEWGARQQYRRDLQQFRSYAETFKKLGMRVGLFHLGDEFYKESTDFYKDFEFVFRQHYREEDLKKYQNCHYLPLGYKSGFCDELVSQPIHQREYLWSFAGQLKESRYEMIKCAEQIPGGKSHITAQWNDPNGLTTKAYAALLSNTKISLCPMGNYSVDCFRIYESLEAGAIPLVEAKALHQSMAVFLKPKFMVRYGTWNQRFWLRNWRYWERTFQSEFPCPLIYDWKNVEALINSIDVETSSEKIQRWWQDYKRSLTQLVQSTIQAAFF